MLNMNSPTVQAMLNNTPQGFGNMSMPVYYGNNPTVETTMQTTFPSPKDMLSQGGQQYIYGNPQPMMVPSSPYMVQPNPYMQANPYMQPQQQFVGGYNPVYGNPAFNGYYNPYMGYGTNFGGIAYQPTEEEIITMQLADLNGFTMEEQAKVESDLYKTISKIVSKNLGRSEEEAKRCEEAFCVYNRFDKQKQEFETPKPVKVMHVQLVRGNEVVADCNPESKPEALRTQKDFRRNNMYIDNFIQSANNYLYMRENRYITLYNSALERQFDNMDLYEFLNNGAGVIVADYVQRMTYIKASKLIGKCYDGQKFRVNLLKNNGVRDKTRLRVIERFTGRYGVMPDGRPVSPGHDPEIASSFSYNVKTGEYEVTAPGFVRDRYSKARQAFFDSLNTQG